MLNDDPASKIIISASGMCDAGRIRHHLKHNLWRQDSAVVFVGYQARGTLGRALVDGAKTVRIFGEEIAVKARIEMIDSFSGHADRDGLLEWVAAMRRKPQKIILVHGEPTVISAFQKSLRQQFDVSTIAAQYNQTIDLGIPVHRASVLIPLTKAEQVTDAVLMLDAIQADFAALIEKTKTDLTTVSPSARYQILASLKDQLAQATAAIIQRNAP